MKEIIILTRNISAEIAFQEKLQLLGYEVFCSNFVLETLLEKRNISYLNIFKIVIFSESVSDEEVIQLLKVMPNYIKSFRVDESSPTTERQEALKNHGLHNWLTKTISTNELRENLANIIFCNFPLKSDETDFEATPEKIHQLIMSLSGREKQVFKQLVAAEGQTVSRNDLSNRLWNGKINSSTLTQLSQFIKQIRDKMVRLKLDKNYLQTEWRSGYTLSNQIIQNMDAETQTILFAG